MSSPAKGTRNHEIIGDDREVLAGPEPVGYFKRGCTRIEID